MVQDLDSRADAWSVLNGELPGFVEKPGSGTKYQKGLRKAHF